MSATILRSKPYLIAEDVLTGLHPVLFEIDADSDEEAEKIFQTQFAHKRNAKLYKLMKEGDNK